MKVSSHEGKLDSEELKADLVPGFWGNVKLHFLMGIRNESLAEYMGVAHTSEH
jgi:hypothetical protein